MKALYRADPGQGRLVGGQGRRNAWKTVKRERYKIYVIWPAVVAAVVVAVVVSSNSSCSSGGCSSSSSSSDSSSGIVVVVRRSCRDLGIK